MAVCNAYISTRHIDISGADFSFKTCFPSGRLSPCPPHPPADVPRWFQGLKGGGAEEEQLGGGGQEEGGGAGGQEEEGRRGGDPEKKTRGEKTGS